MEHGTFGAVARDQDVWRALATSHSARVVIGWFMDRENEGAGVEADVMEELARLSLPLDLDVYSSGPDHELPMADVGWISE
jgi:hypothetical protein